MVNAHVVHEAIRIQGDEELARPPSALAWSGFAAGLTMCFSLVAEGVIQATLPDAPWRPLVVSLGYTFGYLIVIIGRQQLFTENTLTAVIPVLARRDRQTFSRMLRLWGIVLAANLGGAHLAAWSIGNTSMFSTEIKLSFFEIGQRAAAVSPNCRHTHGRFRWMADRDGGLDDGLGARPPGRHHRDSHLLCRARPLHARDRGLDRSAVPGPDGRACLDRLAAFYFLPTLLCNVVGGVALVSLLNHAQVVSGRSRQSDS